MRLLVIEDERKITRAIAKALKRETYAVDAVHDGEEGFNLADSQPYDLLIVDRMLPGMEGAEIVKNLRKNGKNMPILFLTALGTTEDKTFGLDTGADDYLVKPFAIDELLARVRALLRRPPIQQPDVLKIADLTIDKQQQTVMRAGKTIDLTSKEYALLEYLMQHPNQILSKETLIDHVWDFDADILPNNVEAYIKNLRQKIDKPFKKQLIKTVRGFGYRIEA
ncbi:two-component system response regulator RppA [Candidatus Nanosynbacter sp. TM7-074]|uniref:Two-component system response regulator RppA n=1 Tax=Candidatus Nanosynbacter sp. TM7-074 TaxID=3158573 RepID=A0AB39J743_9BACT